MRNVKSFKSKRKVSLFFILFVVFSFLTTACSSNHHKASSVTASKQVKSAQKVKKKATVKKVNKRGAASKKKAIKQVARNKSPVKRTNKHSVNKKRAVKRVANKKRTYKRPASRKKVYKRPARRYVAPRKYRKPVKIPIKRRVQGRVVKLTPARQRNIRIAVVRSIPPEAKINTIVTTIQRPQLKHPTIVVSHLLEGSSATDTDPTVRGDYNTLPKLTRYSQKRAFDIMQSILKGSNLKKISELMVEVNHGVRSQMVDSKGKKIGKAKDVSRNIYSSSASLEKIPAYKWTHMGIDSFMKNWKIEHNIIPQLKITTRIRKL